MSSCGTVLVWLRLGGRTLATVGQFEVAPGSESDGVVMTPSPSQNVNLMRTPHRPRESRRTYSVSRPLREPPGFGPVVFTKGCLERLPPQGSRRPPPTRSHTTPSPVRKSPFVRPNHHRSHAEQPPRPNPHRADLHRSAPARSTTVPTPPCLTKIPQTTPLTGAFLSGRATLRSPESGRMANQLSTPLSTASAGRESIVRE